MRRRSSVFLMFVLGFALLPLATVTGATGAPARADDAPGNPAFLRTWKRTDQPVADGSVARTWMWGPSANTAVVQEDYAEAPGARRDVQYYDKSRMELTHPDAPDDGLFYVTNGLLVVELMTGQLQTGDNTFEPRAPSPANVAGDADDSDGPTYATFASLRNAAPLADGAAITQRVDRAGNVTDDPTLAAQGVTTGQRVQVPGIDHQIASPFWNFMNSTGVVDENGAYVTAALFQNPFYATGYPLTEAYWATVRVAGTPRLVLSQCFERRCLTYTPGNPAGFVVEAGNVGQHYHAWRYAQTTGSVVINEVMYWPAQGPQWLELFNGTNAAQNLSGWSFTNAARTRSVALPAWNVPAGGYLLVTLGDGTDDTDFADGSGNFHAGAASTGFMTLEADGVALYRGAPAADTLADYAAWSYSGVAPSGPAAQDAVAAGQWIVDTFVPGVPPARLEATMTGVVGPGDSLGRGAHGADSNSFTDWRGQGGPDAFGPTPGAANTHGAPYVEQPLAQLRYPQADPQRAWTVMVYIDGRPSDLQADWLSVVNLLERDAVAGSNVNVLVQFAFPSGSPSPAMRWIVNTPDSDLTTIKSPSVQVAPLGDPTTPGDPAALAAFINWSKTNYPASHYAIVLAGHGEGWEGTMHDNGDFLTPSELSTGLSALGQKFDDVIFMSCLMGAVEIGAQIAPQAHYMVASEEISWANWPLNEMLTALRANTNWTPRQFADDVARRYNDHYQAEATATKSSDLQRRTIAAVNLDELARTLVPAVDRLAVALQADLVDVHLHDQPNDNGQIIIKQNVLALAEAYEHRDFKDLGDFARLVLTQPSLEHSQAPAQAVVDLLAHTGDQTVPPIISFLAFGTSHPRSTGLSIYFPHNETLPEYRILPNGAAWPFGVALPNGVDPCDLFNCSYFMAFDNPDHLDPATTDRHLYKRDAAILIPALAPTTFPLRDDPAFSFPNQTHWDEFLHRYYKPVADACVRATGGLCFHVRKVNVGETVTLSGNGSSDSDGPENDNLPAHTTTTNVTHYYWDLDTLHDHPAGPPAYVNGKLYTDCDADGNTEDCDRNNADSKEDDLDATGRTVNFTCGVPGLYEMVLMVWDEEHDFERVGVEDVANNAGRHWLHFNVDSANVLVACVDPNIGRKYSYPENVSTDDDITYVINLPANPALNGPSTASLNDPLPAGLSYNGDLECSLPGCEFDAEHNAITWEGTLGPGDSFDASFSAHVDEDGPTLPEHLQNCAQAFDGAESELLCTSTGIDGGDPELGARKTSDPTVITNQAEPIEYTISVPGNPTPDAPENAVILDPLPDGLTLLDEESVHCSFGECDYDAAHNEVRWFGTLESDEVVTLSFEAVLARPRTTALENCAQFFDGHAYGEVCATTGVDIAPTTMLEMRRE